MKCKICGEDMDDMTSILEEHLWEKHDVIYRVKWSVLVHSFFALKKGAK
jgi:hypothetical protein